MTSSYMAFSPTGYTSPSFSGFKPLGRDKLGLHGIFQHSQQHQLHSLSAADAAHADFLHFTSKSVQIWPNLPTPFPYQVKAVPLNKIQGHHVERPCLRR